MTKRLFFLTAIWIIMVNYLNGQTSQYQNKLITAMALIEKADTLPSNLLIECIPKNDTAFSEFYHLTYHKYDTLVNLNSFYKLTDAFFSSAKSGRKEVYKYLLEMSMYVDGEYAESYYEDVESLINLNSYLFCEMYSMLDKSKKRKLIDYYNANCK